jgi:glutamyl-Q tRNA(Asp) synthetase
LHFGSLVAAVASYADARHQQGEWLLRIEDVDQTRSRPDAEKNIIQTLKAFGMHPDRTPVRQSDRARLYHAALEQLIRARVAYRCDCSRKRVAATAHMGVEGPIYPGTCRSVPPKHDVPAAWRVAVSHDLIGFSDRIVGEIRQNIAGDIGDFVICRIDGFTAYQLAVVVDDFAQGITDVVRGADLLWSTPRQIWLQHQLGYRSPRYAHIPLVYDADRHKLSKIDNAHPVDLRDTVGGLSAAWLHLGQAKPAVQLNDSSAFWEWAIPRWDTGRVPHDRNIRHERSDSL